MLVQAWLYIAPVLLLSIAANIPRFFANRLVVKNTSVDGQLLDYEPTEFKLSESYFRTYQTYFIIPCTIVLPILLMIALNGIIIWTLKELCRYHADLREPFFKLRSNSISHSVFFVHGPIQT